ncbi:hypothetical protein O3M35_000689 [Rhynocoris fuscipes]|uniref:Small ribosomal subunit protein mS29 n=1 Tax=Rhynocoris fuscipes TaxID=488301 RepID=A0AAW1DT77_9HEMI
MKMSLLKLLGKSLIRTESCRGFSANALPATSFATAKRTSENNPSLHTEEQIGLMYTVPSSDADVLFKLGGLPKSFQANIKTFGETCLMIRPSSIEILKYLKKTDYSRPAIRYVIYGKQGCGKSLTLAHILHYAFINNFIILHVPWVWNWFRNERTEVVYSATHSGCVDLPIVSSQWLKHFLLQNNKILSELDLPIKKSYVWNQRENTPAGSHLTELITHGINRVKYAADCVLAIISELKEFSSEKKCKTFVAIDGYNALFGSKTNLRTEDRTPVTPQMVTLTNAFLNITKQDWTNGVVIVTVDHTSANFQALHSHLPIYLLGKTGFEHIDPFIPVEVKEYSDIELNSILDYYEDRRWLQRTSGRHELSFLTNNNPYQLMNVCGAY